LDVGSAKNDVRSKCACSGTKQVFIVGE